MRGSLAFVIAVLLGGCAANPPSPPSAPSPAPGPAAAASAPAPTPAAPSPAEQQARCTASIGELRAWLTKLLADGDGGWQHQFLPRRLHLEEREGPGGWLSLAPMVTIDEDTTSLDGRPVGNSAEPKKPLPELTRILTQLAKHYVERNKQQPDTLALLVDGRAPWGAVASVAQSATQAGFARLAVLFRAKGKAAAPPPSSVDAAFAQLVAPSDPGSPAVLLAKELPADGGPGRKLVGKVFQACPNVLELLPKLAAAERRTHAEKLFAAVPDEIEKCGCKTEMNAVRRWAWAFLGRDRGGPIGRFDVKLASAKDKKPQAVAHEATEVWSKAIASLADAAKQGKPVRLRAK